MVIEKIIFYPSLDFENLVTIIFLVKNISIPVSVMVNLVYLYDKK